MEWVVLVEQLVEKIIQGDKRSAAKAISIIENNDATEKEQLLKLLYPYTGSAKIIGITGTPGAGKSTLVDVLINEIRSAGFTVGVIAIDPSSPFSGGAILGDRIRMQRHTLDGGVFIRSMSNRGYLGGLAKATEEARSVIDALGMDYIIIETVGVGQSELDIINTSDTTIVILTPHSGDAIQIHKAGIMEIADIYVVNKMDLNGSHKIVNDLDVFIKRTYDNSMWQPPIVKTVASEQIGIDLLWDNIKQHFIYLHESGQISKNRNKKLERYLLNSIQDIFNQKIDSFIELEEYKVYLSQLINKEKRPSELSKVIYQRILEQ